MKKIIIANWKANLPIRSSLVLAKKYSSLSQKKFSIVVCPDFLGIQPISILLKKTNISLGAQDASIFPLGAHTGEIPSSALKSLGVKFILVGHSERRSNGETSEITFQKIQRILAEKITPVICIGENLIQHNQNKTIAVLKKQLFSIFSQLSKEEKERRILIAYEPVWSIGSGKALDADEAGFVCRFIKEFANQNSLSKVEVIYGGSVNESNSDNYLKEENISGLLLGGSSLNFPLFSKIVNS
jgi:triosephosphate isomerase